MLRFLLLPLNAVAVGFLIYRLLKIYEYPVPGMKKRALLFSGILLLLLPATMIAGFLKPTMVYLFIYPIGIAMFVYLFRVEN